MTTRATSTVVSVNARAPGMSEKESTDIILNVPSPCDFDDPECVDRILAQARREWSAKVADPKATDLHEEGWNESDKEEWKLEIAYYWITRNECARGEAEDIAETARERTTEMYGPHATDGWVEYNSAVLACDAWENRPENRTQDKPVKHHQEYTVGMGSRPPWLQHVRTLERPMHDARPGPEEPADQRTPTTRDARAEPTEAPLDDSGAEQHPTRGRGPTRAPQPTATLQR